MAADLDEDADSQDRAETFDETHTTREGEAGAATGSQPVTHHPRVERHLDEGLEETFPASDPVSINPGAD